jgi:hypothetical protein
MAQAGKFTELTFVNGGAPAINDTNLNEIERVVELADNQFYRSSDIQFRKYKKYFYQRNCKLVENFDDYTDWTIADAATTLTANDSTNQLMGLSALKIEELNNTAGFCSVSRVLPSTLDLTIFNDGSASTTDDCICFVMYVSDNSKWTQIQFRLGDDFGNCYYYNYTGAIVTGWNSFWPQKSDFTTIGAPTGWNSIDYIRVGPVTAINSDGEYILMNLIQMVRQDPIYSGYANPFQKYMGAGTGWVYVFDQYDALNLLYQDEGNYSYELGFMKIVGSDYTTNLEVYPDCINFISRWEFICKYAGETASMVWYVDSDNYAELYITGNTFSLKVNEGGAATTTTVALTNNLLKDERVEFYFEKNIDTFRGILYKKGEAVKSLEYETSIATDTDGDVMLGQSGNNSYSLLTDFTVSNSMKDLTLQNEFTSQIIKKRTDQIVNNSNVLQNDNDLIAYLDPYSTYEFKVVIGCVGITAGNFKCAYVTTGDIIELTQRVNYGPSAQGTPNTYDTPINAILRNMPTEQHYGTDGVYGTSIIEHFMVKTGRSGGTVRLQWAQVTATVGNLIVYADSSYMEVKKVRVF